MPSPPCEGTDFDTTYIEGRVRPGYEGCQRYTDVRVREGVVAVSNLANPAEVVEVSAGYETTVPCLLAPLSAGPLGIAGAAGPGEAGGRRKAGRRRWKFRRRRCGSRRGRLLGSATWERHFGSAASSSAYAASQSGDRTLGWRANPRHCGLSGLLDSWFWFAHWVGPATPARSYYKICIPAFSNQPIHRSSMRYFSAVGSAARITEPCKRAFSCSRLSRRTVGVVGRITGYQLWVGDHFNNPLAPSTFTHQARLNFARLQGGVEFALYPGTTLFLLGGGDVGDSTRRNRGRLLELAVYAYPSSAELLVQRQPQL